MLRNCSIYKSLCAAQGQSLILHTSIVQVAVPKIAVSATNVSYEWQLFLQWNTGDTLCNTLCNTHCNTQCNAQCVAAVCGSSVSQLLHILLQHTAAAHCCSTLLQHTAATHCCITLLQHAITMLLQLAITILLKKRL